MNRGSEWRRWELHLHTPGTKKNDGYIGNTLEEKWENFYASIRDYVGDGTDPLRVVCAIAVTDYLSIDNYLKMRKDNALPDSVKLLLPNVELRMEPMSKDAPVNIHCIFSTEIVDNLDDLFFSRLSFGYGEDSYGATKSELIRLGRAFTNDPTLDEEVAYRTGIDQYVISIESLSEVFKKSTQLRENTVIVVSNSNRDGVSGLRAHSDYFEGDISQLEAKRRSIYQLSDMIFSPNPKDIQYFLGEKENSDNAETVKFKCGSLKPCIHGCDAHSNDKIFSPDGNRYCWIKADPTFEGLKQILYEPKDRVSIGSSIPDFKPDYQVIDHVVIDNENFASDPIYFNDKLNCIIGGKSTGKSLLLHNIAFAIDQAQVEQKCEIATTNVRPITGVRVVWRDGSSSDDAENDKKIVYIPQTYLNRLSDKEQETTEIDKIIQGIVLQDDECQALFDSLQRKIAEKKSELAKTLIDFLNIDNKIKELREQQKEFGDKQSIDKEISKLLDQSEALSKEYNVTEAEINAYQAALGRVQICSTKLAAIAKEEEIITKIQSVIEIRKPNGIDISICLNDFNAAIRSVEDVANQEWIKQRENILLNLKEQRAQIEKEMEGDAQIALELKPKVDGNEQLTKISTTIVEERRKLETWLSLDEKIKIAEEEYRNLLSQLSNCFEDFSKFYSEYVDSINEKSVNATSDLEFSARKVLRINQLSTKISDIINNRTYNRFTGFSLQNLTEVDLTADNISKLIESIIANSNTSLQLKGGYSPESALRELLTDWYNIDYVVKMDGDTIQEMSPGKKALVLLRLLISLAESSCPILIDQPEDDLDNRSIFDELIHFIKERKISRQIITVTHNANIVLGGDAELVIVANQHGSNVPNHLHHFEYREGAIEDNHPVIGEDGKVISGILNNKGIQEHICEILEGGEQAFALRKNKYYFIKA